MSQPTPESNIARRGFACEVLRPAVLVADVASDAWLTLRGILGGEFELEAASARVEIVDALESRARAARPFSIAVIPWERGRDAEAQALARRLGECDPAVQIVLWIEDPAELADDPPPHASSRTTVVQNSPGAHPHIRRIFRLLAEKCEHQHRTIRDRQDLRSAQDRAALLDHVPDAIFVQDFDGRLIWWSQGAARIYGWSADEVLGSHICDLLGDAPAHVEECLDATRRAGSWTGKRIHHSRDGQELRVQSSWTLVRDAHGNPESVLVVNTDVTVREQLELKSIRAQRLETIGTFADGIAHDLNNALQPIAMAMDLIGAELTSETSRRMLEDVRRNADRAAGLIEQIVSFARNTHGEYQPLHLADLVSEISTVVRNAFPQTIEFHVSAPAADWITRGDMAQLCQAVLNLCMNARDAMPDGGVLTLEVKQVLVDEHFAALHSDARAGTFFVIKIVDTGDGIPADIRERIFDPFFTTKTFTQNSGLGLPTALTIVRSHCGFITLSSRKQRGTTVRVFLPIESAGAPEETPHRDEVSENARTFHLESQDDTPLILLVDDEESVARLIQLTLEKAHYDVLVAADGAEGLRIYERNRGRIRLILTDMVMPILDGPGMIAAIKALDPQARIVAMTGMTTKASIRAVRQLGVARILSKPCSSKIILDAVREALRN